MAKSIARIQSRELRRGGHSINYIASKLCVSKGSASRWCDDIKLSKKQIEKLLKSSENNITRGRLIGAQMQKNRRFSAIKLAKEEAKTRLKKLTNNQFWIAGLSLYLAEGYKKRGSMQFANSDPRVIDFMIKWLKKFFDIGKNDMGFSVYINKIHKKRDSLVKKYWQDYLKIKPERFTNTRFIKSRQNKIYENHHAHFGTLHFRIKKSTNLLYRLKAYIDQLLYIKSRRRDKNLWI